VTNTYLTWLGHGSFRLETPGGLDVYVDPWLEGNPSCPEHERLPECVDVVAVTHGHFDHIGDVVSLARRFNPAVICQYELAEWFKNQGVHIPEDRPGMGIGGTAMLGDVAFTMTPAVHSAGIVGGSTMTYGGQAAGFVVTLEDDYRIYFSGDTTVFGDMALIRELYAPDLAVLPIGGYLTMGPREAAAALRLLGVSQCVPCHYGTIPLLTGTPAELRDHAVDVEVLELVPGVSVRLGKRGSDRTAKESN
jgi:L-ascorbate metabolism protein UlaG (beta-lactamase superfamily)